MLEIISSNFLKASNYLADNFPTDKRLIVHVMEGYDTIETPDGMGFGVFVPETLEIYIAGDMTEKEEGLIRTLAHEFKHFIQYCDGKPFDELEAEEFAEEIYKKVTSAEETPVCEYCKIPEKYLDVIDTEDRVFVGLSGEYIQIFNESYPGYVHNIRIKYCPICGRKLKGAAGNE